MKKRDRIIIVLLVGVMLFSVFATGLLLVVGSSTDDNDITAEANQQLEGEQEVCQVSSDAITNPGNPVGPWPYETEPATELVTEDLQEGDGQEVALGDCISVHYRLALADGKQVEGNNTFEGGQPIAFDLVQGGLIEGWTQGIPGMKVGGVRRLVVPPSLGYGDSASNPAIPPNSTLVFEVEIIEVQ